jgi:hypothetical protein
MPSAPWLLVCPLLAVKNKRKKGARRSELWQHLTWAAERLADHVLHSPRLN